MLGTLREDYTITLRLLYRGRLTAFNNLVTYWFERSRIAIKTGRAKRAGLLATNSIAKGANLSVMKRIKDTGNIFMAWRDREWILDGAKETVVMIGFDDGTELRRTLDGIPVSEINPDLTGDVDLTVAVKLRENKSIAFIGVQKSGLLISPRNWLTSFCRLQTLRVFLISMLFDH